MKKLLLLLLFTVAAYAQPNINPPMDLTICESNPGMATFDLTVNTGVVLAGLNPDAFTVTYYDTLTEANAGMGAISNPNNFASVNNNVIYVRITENSNPTNYTVANFSLMIMPLPMVPDLPAITQCSPVFDLTANSNLIEGSVDVSYHTALSDAEAGFNAIANPQSYVSETSASVWVRVSNNASCYTIKEQQLIIIAGVFEVTIQFNAQTIIFTTTPEGDYEYSLDGGEWQNSPNFYNIAYGSHTGQVRNSCGITVALTIELTPIAPTGQSEQTFNQGDTLADIEVEGDNIQWYDNDGQGMPDFPDGTSLPLPLSTVLVDGTTYYASQTIDGVESSQRMAVTVNLTAGIEDITLNTLNYYPNPTTNILTIENSTNIDSVSVANALEQSVITKSANSNSAQIDVSSLSKGVYFVTVSSGNASKTIKIIKE